MKRRQLLIGTALFAVGAAVSPLLNRLLYIDSSFQPGDAEKTLLGFYEPAFADLQQLFPEISSYTDALLALQQRNLLVRGLLDLGQLEQLAKTDPIMDFKGWQHLQSELLIYLAAYLLVSEALCDGECDSPPQLQTHDHMQLLSDIDFYGQDIKAVKIEQADDRQAATQCAELCQQEKDCEFFTLATHSHPVVAKQHNCWLKGPGVAVRKNPHYISGIKQRR
ncbi:MAG: PAN domain-containing protein [Chromatiales bacterium]|jgi:hypothetical protein